MKKRVIAFGACAVVAATVVMPVSINATQLGLHKPNTQVIKTQREGQAYAMKVRVTNAKGNPIEGAKVHVKEVGGSNENTLTTNAEGLVDVQLPGYMKAEINVSVPGQGERVVKKTITYGANTTPDKELTIAWTAEGPKEEKPLTMKIAVQSGTGNEPVVDLDVKIECENRESQTVKTDELGVLNFDLPGYGTYKLTSEAPEGHVKGIDTVIEYSETNTPKTDMVIELQKEGDELTKSTREVVIKHVDANTGEIIKGGKAQIVDATSNTVVVENVDLSSGEISVGELERGELYIIQWLEDAKGYNGVKEVQEFTVMDEDGAQIVEFASTKEGEEAPAVKTKLTLALEDKVSKEPIKNGKFTVMDEDGAQIVEFASTKEGEEAPAVKTKLTLALEDKVSKEPIKNGKLTLVKSDGEKESFEVDFSKPETLTLDVMSNDKYAFKFTQLPAGYILPADATNEFSISPDDKGNQTYTIQLMKESASGNKYAFKFTQLPAGYILPADATNEFSISPDDKGNQTYTIQLMKESASGSLGGGATTGGGSLPQTGSVATGIGFAGMTTIGAFLAKRKFRK